MTSFGLYLIHPGFTSRSKTKQPALNGVSCPGSIKLGQEDIGKYVTVGDSAIMTQELQLIDTILTENNNGNNNKKSESISC